MKRASRRGSISAGAHVGVPPSLCVLPALAARLYYACKVLLEPCCVL